MPRIIDVIDWGFLTVVISGYEEDNKITHIEYFAF